ncbi:MAG: hypothetical protein AB7I30_20450, partial [Isosphaeraceae bacterium]
MTRPRALVLGLAAALAAPAAFQAIAQPPAPGAAPAKAVYAGPTAKGFLLPNGWTISPAGEQVELTDLPLNVIPLADGKHALAASSGFNAHNLVVVDLETKAIVDTESVRQSWFGLALDEPGGRVWWSGGGGDTIHAYSLKGRTLERTSDPEPEATAKTKAQTKGHFRGGLALSPDGKSLYSLDVNAGSLTEVPLAGGESRTSQIADRPYDVVVSRNGARLYVSDWAARRVVAVDPTDLRVVARIAVGEHPNQIVGHPKDDRLFVACASSNCVSVIDTRRGIVTETIYTPLFPRSPEGSTPDALAIAPDGATLYVANADNNCVAVIDVSTPNKSQVKGFIPTGWYPTSVAVTPDGKKLLIGVGKGNQTKPNPPNGEYAKKIEERIAQEKIELTPERKKELMRFPYIGTTLSGALSIVPVPDDAQLATYTETVYRNCPYSDAQLTEAPAPGVKTAIPTRVGDPSPIKHVIYIIKENRTYDQVFGAMEKGNGDPSLVLFGEDVTPNHHKIARQFVLLDNLYCNGHVSADGHPWSTMAYNTDYIARNWALTYSRRSGIDDDDEGDLSNAPSGYLWDACARAGLTYRSYGEYGKRVSQPDGSTKMDGRVPGLVGHVSPDYGAGA